MERIKYPLFFFFFLEKMLLKQNHIAENTTEKCYWNNRITDNQRANVVENVTEKITLYG